MDFTQAIAVMQANYSAEYSHEKISILFDMVKEDKWTKERFSRTLKWMLKNRKFADWTIADWFSYSVNVYPYSWYLKQVQEHGAGVNNQIEVYLFDNETRMYKYIDGNELPFPRKLIGEDSKPIMIICDECGKQRQPLGVCEHCGK